MLWTIAGWPIWIGCVLMIIAAVIDARTRIIPKAFSVPAAIAGLSVSIAFGEGGPWPMLHGGIASSLGVAGITLVVLALLFALGLIAGGSVKMHTAFAAWLGCALPFWMALLLSLVVVAVILLGFFLAVLAIKHFRGTTREPCSLPSRYSQAPMTLLTIGTVLAFHWMGLI